MGREASAEHGVAQVADGGNGEEGEEKETANMRKPTRAADKSLIDYVDDLFKSSGIADFGGCKKSAQNPFALLHLFQQRLG